MKSITTRCFPRGAKSNGGGDQGSERRPQNERMRAMYGIWLARNLLFVCLSLLFLCNRNWVRSGVRGLSFGTARFRSTGLPRMDPSPPLPPSPRHLESHPGSHMEHLGEPFGGGASIRVLASDPPLYQHRLVGGLLFGNGLLRGPGRQNGREKEVSERDWPLYKDNKRALLFPSPDHIFHDKSSMASGGIMFLFRC